MPGGAGAGGAIHLVAPTILGDGQISVYSGNSYPFDSVTQYVPAATGIIRLSATTNNFAGGVNVYGGLLSPIVSPLYLPPASSTLQFPSLTITSVNGVAVPPEASGQYLTPDVIIGAPGAVTVNLAAANIPLGTIVTLRITAGAGAADTTISCNALTGTLAASTATCSASFPYTVSIAGVRASW